MKKVLTFGSIFPQLEDSLRKAISAELAAAGTTVPEAVIVKRASTLIEPEMSELERSIKMYISTRKMDRDDEIVVPAGGVFTHYKMNPVVLACHDYHKPQIGKIPWLQVDEMGVKAVVQFAPTDEGELYWKLAQFMPLAASVGFVPLDVTCNGDSEWGKACKKYGAEWPEFDATREKVRRIYRKWIMLENSIVPLPSNPAAIQMEISKALDAGKIKDDDARMVRKGMNINAAVPITVVKPESETEMEEEESETETEPEKAAVVPDNAPVPKSEKPAAVAVKVLQRPIAVKVLTPQKDISDMVREALEIKSGRI